MEDSQIIGLYFARDEQAITETDSKYGTMCRSIAVRILGNIDDADECVNDTYLKTWNSIPPNNPDSLCAFVGRITRNLSLDKYRKNKAAKRNTYFMPLEELAECIADFDDAGGEDVPFELKAAINEFLDELPQEHRVYFMRRYWLGESLTDISKRYGISANKLGVMLFRIRKRLKTKLEKSKVLL